MKVQLSLVFALACRLFAEDPQGNTSKSEGKNSPVGYVDCSNRDKNQLTPTYLNPCEKLPGGNLGCGQRVTVVEMHGTWLRIDLPDGSPRYALASVISKNADTFAPFDSDAGIVDLGPPSCPVPTKHQGQAPRLLFDPQPEYSDQARKKKINGTVVLSLTVGIDGLPHNIRVERKLGYGLDEKALEAVRKWKFQPALRDGQPVETQITASVSFKLY